MNNTINQTLQNSKFARWSTLAIISFTMLCGYYFTDVMAPLKGLLENNLHWTSTEYGIFTSAYGWFNVFMFLLIVGGIILDRKGIRFTGIMATTLMVIGASIKYWAISTHSLDGVNWQILFLNYKAQVWIAGLGFAIFGVGIEIAGITVSKTIVKWFKGKELALAMGLEMAMARIGTGLALMVSAPIANSTFGSISTPILFGVVLLCIGFISFIVYTIQDKKFDAELGITEKTTATNEDFKLSDLKNIVTNKAWWLIAILCMLFYSSVFPFLKYATDLMVNKFHVDPKLAGLIPSLLPFGTILLTPVFGSLYDRVGKGASIMILGSLMLILVHGLFAVPMFDSWIFAIVLIITLGIAFSLVPSAMWPSVPKIIPENQLGTAFSMIFWIQNWGLLGVPLLIGYLLETYCKIESVEGVISYDYTLPMICFMICGILSFYVALLLKREDRIKGYGLELPNIQK